MASSFYLLSSYAVKLSCVFLSLSFSYLQAPKPKPRKTTQPTKPSDHYRLNLGNIPFVVGQVRNTPVLLFCCKTTEGLSQDNAHNSLISRQNDFILFCSLSGMHLTFGRA